MVASIFTLVAMSADRYLAVSFPLETKHLRTPRAALATALVIWMVAVCVASPWIPVYTVKVYNETWWLQPISVCADDWTDLRGGISTVLICIFSYCNCCW
jgi:galanin receptor 2